MTRESKNKQRKKYTLQLRPYVGTALSELIDYLQSVDKAIAKSKIEDILLAALLPVARLHSGKYTQEQLRLTCLESCESLDKYSSFLRQILMISLLSKSLSHPGLPQSNKLMCVPLGNY